MYFSVCPRCGTAAYERLSNHSYCIECNYFPEQNEELTRWRKLEFKCNHAKASRHAEHGRSDYDELYLRGVL